MIIEFKVKNFKSIKEEQTLSFLATDLQDNRDSIREFSDIKLLKTATMYGANASGKSNLIDALDFFQNFVGVSFKESEKNDHISFNPFAFSNNPEKIPSSFELSFITEDDQVVTYGFSINKYSVLEEHLYIDGDLYFDRNEKNFTFNPEKDTILRTRVDLLNENSLFLSLLASTNDEIGIKIYDWIKFNIVTFTALRELNYHKTTEIMLNNKDDANEQIKALTKLADLGISDISVVKKEEKFEVDRSQFPHIPEEVFEKLIDKLNTGPEDVLQTTHSFWDEKEGKMSQIPIHDDIDKFESDGTKQYLAILGHLIDAMNNGKTLVIDELGARFHPIMLRAIIQLFNEKQNNKGQLFFTTHDVSNLDSENFRRDQVWFSEKDQSGATHFTSLVEFKFESKRDREINDMNFSKNYMQGKYGAIPFIDFTQFNLMFNNGDRADE